MITKQKLDTRSVESGSHRAPVLDATVPQPARVWNYWLGGKDHFHIDRQTADEYRDSICPTIADLLHAAHGHTRQVTHRLTEADIDQFIDIGVGLPTNRVLPRGSGSTRVYVDNDPVALAHGRALLANEPRTTVLAADARDPELASMALRPLDPARPVVVVLGCLLGHLTTIEATMMLETLRTKLPAGSQILVTDLTTDDAPHLIATHPAYHIRPWRAFAALTRTTAGPVSLTTITSDTSSGVTAVAAHITIP